MKFVCLSSILLTACAALRAAEPPAPGHESHASASQGRKLEMIEGIKPEDFLRLGDKPNTVKLLVIAVYTDENYGMNFNGYAKGKALYTIPRGWTVEVSFINPSPIPHSLMVCEKADTKKVQVAAPYFKGAAIADYLKGVSYAKADFSFVAEEAGEFALACGFPTHALNGHWIGLDISAEAKVPTLQLGNQAAMEASPAKK